MRTPSSFLFIAPLLLFSFLNLVSCSENHYKVLFAESNPRFISVVAKFSGPEKYYQQQSNLHFLILNFTVFFQSPSEFRITITDRLHKRWEIPEQDPYPHDKGFCINSTQIGMIYRVDITKSPFSFKIVRVSNNEVIFNTEDFNFIMSERYLEFSSALPSENIFGIGERVSEFKLNFPSRLTIWARDLPGVIDDERSGAQNTYGLFPVYLNREKGGYFNMVYLRNSNGMDVFLDRKSDQTPYITYKIVGGIIDLKFFLSESKSAEEPVKAYHKYIGGYTLPPFWSFGYHQCRWGYKSWSQLNQVLTNFQNAGIPLDAIWMDIDYMEEYRIFTIDDSRYHAQEMQNQIKNQFKKKLVLILDPGVKVDGNYHAYQVGKQRDIFVKHVNGQPLLASVWPGDVHFVDFMNPDGRKFWGEMLEELHKKIEYDGIWLDMNENSNFVNGAVCQGSCGSTAQLCGYHEDSFYYVYNPGNKRLDDKAVCLNALHYDGSIEYNVHNFNGLMETIATYEYLKNKLKQPQPFILSRSTVPGSGKFTAHWTGDNVSTFQWMVLSIAGVVNFNIFGVPHVGADICGFDQNTSEELCRRWMQLGTLYPFSRNHNHINSREQDPFSFGNDLKETAMTVIKFRYSLVKYYYYLFVRNKAIGTVFRPVFFEFPNDEDCYKHNTLEKQFLLGDALLVTPVLDQGTNDITPYFPGNETIWYDVETGVAFAGGKENKVHNEMTQTAPVFLREGYSIYRQNVDNVTRTDDLDNKVYFSVAFKKNYGGFKANGQFMACENYGNFEDLTKCIDGDCLVNVEFNANIIEGNAIRVQLNLTSNSQNSSSTYDSVGLTGLEIYGGDFFNNRTISKTTLGSIGTNGEIVEIAGNTVNVSDRNNIKVLKFDTEVKMQLGNNICIQFS